MHFSSKIFLCLLVLQGLCYICPVESDEIQHDFFYFVQTWPGSLCNKKAGCCYPATGRPATNFTIQGLWPILKNKTFLEYCSDTPFNENEISNLTSRLEISWPSFQCGKKNKSYPVKFWTSEWEKRGTCVESEFDQYEYFEAALDLKDSVDLLKILKNAGIQPDGKFYKLDAIKEAVIAGTGYEPIIDCNYDAKRNPQLYQIWVCADHTASRVIECPVIVTKKCNETLQFPVWGDSLMEIIPNNLLSYF